MQKAISLILLAVSLSQAGEPLAALQPPAITLKSPTGKIVQAVAPFKVGELQYFTLENYTGKADEIEWDADGDSLAFAKLTKDINRLEWPDPNGKPIETVIPAGSIVIRGQKAGVTKLSAWGVVDGKAKKLATRVIEVEGARPPPDPRPDPKPEPYVGKWRMLIVEETADAAENRGQFFSDATLSAYIRAKCSHRPRVVEQDVKSADGKPPADISPWLALAKGKKLPQLFITSDTGAIIWSGDLPATPAALLAKLKEVGGE